MGGVLEGVVTKNRDNYLYKLYTIQGVNLIQKIRSILDDKIELYRAI